MDRRKFILVFSVLVWLGFTNLSAQDFSEEEINEIKRKAERQLDEYENLLNQLASPGLIRRTAFEMINYTLDTTNRGRIFIDKSVAIESDLNPNASVNSELKVELIEKYLRDFQLYYNKSENKYGQQVVLDVLEVTDPAQTAADKDIYFVTVTAERQFRSRHSEFSSIPYQRLKRKFTFWVQYESNNWQVRIAGIGFDKTGLPSLENLIYPEKMTLGKAYEVSWEKKNFKNGVDIFLYQGEQLIKVITENISKDSYSWQVGDDILPSNYNIKIKRNGAELPVVSGSVLQIIEPAQITVNNLIEEVSLGENIPISWQTRELLQGVKIELFQGEKFIQTLIENEITGSYTWKIPANFKIGDNYILKILSLEAPDLAVYSNTFSIKDKSTIELNKIPKKLKQDKPIIISWTQQNNDVPVKLELLNDNKAIETIVEGTTNSSFEWIPGNSLKKGSTYRIKLSTENSELPALLSNTFTVRTKGKKLGLKIAAGATVISAAILLLSGGNNDTSSGTSGDETLPSPPDIN